MTRPTLTTAALAIALIGGAAQAATINTPGTFAPTQAIVDFEDTAAATFGPLTFGDLTISAAASGQRVNRQGFTQFPDIFEGQYFGFAATTFTLAFAVDVSDVGFGLFDPNVQGTRIDAFDRAGNLLETLMPPLGPTGGVFSTYVGFSRATGDIARVQAVAAGNDILGVDTIAWRTAAAAPPSPIPVPASLPLLLAGIGGLGWVARRRRSTKA